MIHNGLRTVVEEHSRISLGKIPDGSCVIMSGWWFGTFFIGPYIGNNNPNWLIFSKGVGIPPTRTYLAFGKTIRLEYNIWNGLMPPTTDFNTDGLRGRISHGTLPRHIPIKHLRLYPWVSRLLWWFHFGSRNSCRNAQLPPEKIAAVQRDRLCPNCFWRIKCLTKIRCCPSSLANLVYD
jgi:hypothetical protein